MLNEETKRKLRLMNLYEFVEAVDVQNQVPEYVNMPFDLRFQYIVDSVYHEKYNSKVQKLIKSAKFRLPKADIHDVFYDPRRNIDRSLIAELGTCKYILENKSIILRGYTSSGKTFLGCALGKEACRQQHRTRYIRLPDLLMEFDELSLEPGGKEKILKKYSAFRLLILDEWLISDMSKAEIEFIFELSERRFDTTSTIFCTLYKNDDWIKRLGKGVYAESIVERYAHNSIAIETGDMNMRAIFSRKSAPAGAIS